MSSGLECSFIEPVKGRWYYILEDESAPKVCWDWREHATCYGGFNSFDEAYKHLHDNHCNPGGFSTTDFEHFKFDETYIKLVGESITPEAYENIFRPRFRYPHSRY